MSFYKEITSNIHEVNIVNPKKPKKTVKWINITDAGKNEIEFLRKFYNFNLAQLQASSAKARSQRPEIIKNDGYLFITLHFPVLRDGTIVPGEINFFIGPDYLVALHDNIKTVNDFFSLCKKEEDQLLTYKLESSAVLLYEILQKLMSASYSLLDQNSIAINEVEDLIFSQKQKKAVSNILDLRRNIINTRKITQNHKNIIEKLSDSDFGLVPEKRIKKYYNELLTQSKRFWENLEAQKEMIEVLNNTNESLLNYQLSDIMKTLTIFSVIVFPLTLLAAIFGMNTTAGMPFMHTENGFWVIIVIMMVGCLAMIIVFAKKRWL